MTKNQMLQKIWDIVYKKYERRSLKAVKAIKKATDTVDALEELTTPQLKHVYDSVYSRHEGPYLERRGK